MQDHCLLVCNARSLGLYLFSTDSWMGYIHSVADVGVVTRGESLSYTRHDEVSSRPLYWMKFFFDMHI